MWGPEWWWWGWWGQEEGLFQACRPSVLSFPKHRQAVGVSQWWQWAVWRTDLSRASHCLAPVESSHWSGRSFTFFAIMGHNHNSVDAGQRPFQPDKSFRHSLAGDFLSWVNACVAWRVGGSVQLIGGNGTNQGKGGLPWWLSSKESLCSVGDTGDSGSNPGSGRSPGGGNGNPLQYSCLGIPWTERSLAGYSRWLQRVRCENAHTPRGRGRLMWGKEGAGCVWCVSHSVVSDSFPPDGLEPARLLCPWDSLGKHTGVGCHRLSKRSSGPRNRVQKITQVSCIKGRFFTIWTTREAPGGTEEPRECHTILSLPLFFFLVFEHFLKDFFDVDHF